MQIQMWVYVCYSPAQVVIVLYAVAIAFSYGLQFFVPTSIVWPSIEPRVPKAYSNIAETAFRIVVVICTGEKPSRTSNINLITGYAL
jgi:hypothetical protein